MTEEWDYDIGLKNLKGQIVATREKDSYVQIPARCIDQSETNGTYTVKYAAGNTEVLKAQYVIMAMPWIKEEWASLTL